MELELNNIEIAKRAHLKKGLPLLDLTESNPTKCGFIYPSEVLQNAANSYLQNRLYSPDSQGLLQTREAIANYYKLRFPKRSIAPEQIIITASTSEAYRFILSILCNPGDNVLSPDITYPLFEYFAEDQKINLQTYRILENRNWEIDPFSLDVALDKKTKALLLVSPHNPTGKYQKKRDENIAALNLPLIVDEVFMEFCHNNSLVDITELYPELPIFQLNGISKMFALPDLKIGWIVMNKKAAELYGEKLAFLNDTYLNASTLNQTIVAEVFKTGLTFTEEMTKKVTENVSYVRERLINIGFPDFVMPDGGAFILAPLPYDMDEEQFVLKLIGSGVFVHPGYFYNANGKHIMISCLLSKELLKLGLDTIEVVRRERF